MIASSSVSLSDCAPLARSFSRGRSSSGQSLMVWYEAIDTSRCLETESEPAVLGAEFVYHTARGLVQGAQREPFEVFAFGMMQANGMIDRLAGPFEQGDCGSRVDGGAQDDFLEKSYCKVWRGSEGERQA